MTYDAILFDLDGTLIDSIDLWGQAICDMFRSVGVTVTMEEFHTMYRPSAQLTTWLTHFGVNMTRKEELRAIRDARYSQLLRERVQWLPDAEELLRALAPTTPLGLVTGSWMSYVHASDERLSLKQYFRTVVTQDAMGNFSKPHPHGLLLACDAMHVQPSRCIYIGDMEADVEMAHAAGMPCCLVQGRYTAATAREKADMSVTALQQVQHTIGIGPISA